MSIAQLVPWDSTTPDAVAQQILARVRDAKNAGQSVQVVACLVLEEPDGATYEVVFSEQRPEQILWAAKQIEAEGFDYGSDIE